MILSTFKIFTQHKRQFIKHLDESVLTERFRGVPILKSVGLSGDQQRNLVDICPTKALSLNPLRLDMGRCIFCGECARRFPENITFTNQWRMWSYTRDGLVVEADKQWQVSECAEPFTMFKNALKLRQVSSGGDGACEMELGASENVNFDLRRYGVQFVASPRHSDGIVITGPITKNMARATEITYAAIAQPKVVIAVGADAISGGLYADSPAIDRAFFERHKPNLYVPGHPAHPLTFIGGVLGLIGSKF